jgi:hypothetical protein
MIANQEKIFTEGQRVKAFPNGYDKEIIGYIRGVSSEFQPVIGRGYIIELENKIPAYHYSCISVPQCLIEEI